MFKVTSSTENYSLEHQKNISENELICCDSNLENSSEDEFYDDKNISNSVAEAQHFMHVRHSLATYQLNCMSDVSRIEQSFQSLSGDDKKLLIEDVEKRINDIKAAIAENQKFLNLFLIDQKPLEFPNQYVDAEPSFLPGTKGSQFTSKTYHNKVSTEENSDDHQFYHKAKKMSSSTRARNASKVRSTLRQFVRDWSEEGQLERDSSYKPLLQDLDQYLDINKFKLKNSRLPRVLCPGAGLGRLALEIVLKGYQCQGNEFSYYMLLGSNLILNSDLKPCFCSIYPFCLSTSNRLEKHDHLQEIKIPDISPSDLLSSSEEFSMCAGEFVEVYQDQVQEWDGIVTCFFLDTAKNVIAYIRTIATALKPGAVWANLGPLLYHFAEMPNELSIELSWEELKYIILRYFDIVKEEQVDAYYTTNYKSIMQVQYHCIHFVGIRNNKLMDGKSYLSY